MLTVSDLSYKIGARTILDECDVTIMNNWKVGVVGLNGAGKSTLFKLIAGELTPDGGTVEMSAKQRMGMVRQDIPEVETSLLDLVLEAHTEMADLWKQTETEEDPNKIADIYQRLSDMDAYSAPSKASRLLTGLGFTEDQLSEPFSSFSGGWRMRIALARALFIRPSLLLLDEPTNHLDLEACVWLESELRNYSNCLLIISHSQDFLNGVCTNILLMRNKGLKVFGGNYDSYMKTRMELEENQMKQYKWEQDQISHMKASI